MPSLPNILVVIVDDMSAHQVGCYGSSFFETPCLDRFASESARFNAAYSASPVCSPARAALYTGLHPARLHLTNFIPGTEPDNPRLLTPRWRAYLPVEVDTLGDIMKARGYATAHYGKWHLAPDYHYRPGRPMDPESQGFDRVQVTRKPLADANPEGDPHHIDALTDTAIQFLSERRDRPFLCIVAHNALHRPEIAPAGEVERFARKAGADNGAHRPVLAAMAAHVDRATGRLLDHVRESGLDDNTIVLITADHGAMGPSDHRKPWRGAKADLYEGGLRVPLMIRWRGHIKPAVIEEPVFGTDIFATLLDLAGIKSESTCDGISLRARLESDVEAIPDRPLCWHFPHYHHLGIAPSGAIRSGRWKLVEWFERSLGGATDGPAFELFDLVADAGESVNLADAQPATRDRLARQLREWRGSVGAQEMIPNPSFKPTAAAKSAPPPPGDPGNPFGE
jgi:arylsulfatase A